MLSVHVAGRGIGVSGSPAHQLYGVWLEDRWTWMDRGPMSMEAATALIAEERAAGRPITFVPGVFDVLHPGHIALLEGARDTGGLVVAGVLDDASSRVLKGPGRPGIPDVARVINVGALESVDCAVIVDGLNLAALVDLWRPDVTVLGAGDQSIPRADLLSETMRIVEVPLVPGFASSTMLRRIVAGIDGVREASTAAPQPRRAEYGRAVTSFLVPVPALLGESQPISRMFSFRGPSQDDLIFRAIKDGRAFYEANLLLQLIGLVRPQGLAIDVGANFGNHTCFFAAFLADRVLSLEPVPELYSLLDENIRANGLTNVLALPVAAGAGSGRGEIFRPIGSATNAGSIQVRSVAEDRVETGDLVPIESVDVLLDRNATELDGLPVTLLKIDVEGSEVAVLLGAQRTIERYRPTILVELTDDRTFTAAVRFLNTRGYHVRTRYGSEVPTYLFTAES